MYVNAFFVRFLESLSGGIFDKKENNSHGRLESLYSKYPCSRLCHIVYKLCAASVRAKRVPLARSALKCLGKWFCKQIIFPAA